MSTDVVVGGGSESEDRRSGDRVVESVEQVVEQSESVEQPEYRFPSFANPQFIQVVVSQAIAVVNHASSERGECWPDEFEDAQLRSLDPEHEVAFHDACMFLSEYFRGVNDALKRENRHYRKWADANERRIGEPRG